MELILIVNSAAGIYTGQWFAEHYGQFVTNAKPGDIDILLAGPEHEKYIEVWAEELNGYELTIDGKNYFVFESEDLWLAPEGMEIPEEMHC